MDALVDKSTSDHSPTPGRSVQQGLRSLFGMNLGVGMDCSMSVSAVLMDEILPATPLFIDPSAELRPNGRPCNFAIFQYYLSEWVDMRRIQHEASTVLPALDPAVPCSVDE